MTVNVVFGGIDFSTRQASVEMTGWEWSKRQGVGEWAKAGCGEVEMTEERFLDCARND